MIVTFINNCKLQCFWNTKHDLFSATKRCFHRIKTKTLTTALKGERCQNSGTPRRPEQASTESEQRPCRGIQKAFLPQPEEQVQQEQQTRSHELQLRHRLGKRQAGRSGEQRLVALMEGDDY